MRRAIALPVAFAVALLALAGCAPLISEDGRMLSVYASFYPIYALTDALLDGIPDISLHCMAQPQDGCLRAYQLSDWDARLLASADAVIIGGRGLEAFEGTLFGWGEGGPAVAAVLYNLELYNRSASHTTDEGSHLEGANPHLYMSIEGARRMVEAIAAALMTLDPAYADRYAQNESAALERLDALSAQAEALTAGLAGQPVILMNEALIYPARDCGLTAAAWIDRESGDAMDGSVLEECLETLNESGAKVVLIERQAPAALVESLKAAGYAVARIDVFSTHREGERFDTYLERQLENARAISEAYTQLKAEREESD